MACRSDTVRGGERPPASSDDQGTSVQPAVQRPRGLPVTVCGVQHSLGDTGHLDFGGRGLGPAEAKEIAAFLASPDGAAVRRLTLSGNAITSAGRDLSGLRALCTELPNLENPISLDLANCGFGAAELKELAQAMHAGAAPVEAVVLDGNPIGGPASCTSFGVFLRFAR